MLKYLVFSASLLMAAGSSLANDATMRSYTPNRADTARIYSAFVQQLKDADSAQFSDISAWRSDEGTVEACGFVNAKNSYGAYVGFAPFWLMLLKNGGNVLLLGSDAPTRSVIVSKCKTLRETPPRAAAFNKAQQKALEEYRGFDDACRGGAGDSPETAAACESRDAMGPTMDQLNLCYGRPDDYGYERQWRHCDE